MLKSIQNPKQYIARVLAVYYYYKFIKPVIRDLGRYDAQSLISELLKDYLDEVLIDKLSRVPVEKIRDICADPFTRNELNKVIENNYKNFGQWFTHSPEWVTESLLFGDEDSDDERLIYDALDMYDSQLNKFLNDNGLFPDNCYFEENGNNLELILTIDGDWKHDHLYADMLVRQFAEKNNFAIIDVDTQTEGDSPDDSYRANHIYRIEVINKDDLKDKLEETYSQEELDKLVGKTFNQQKILNIYRRQKYNDSRLFAHTRCVNCGREKKVFLSNLINDPDKYGSCVCSDVNVDSKLDNIEDLYDGSKKLSNNTSGYTGVSYVKTYKGELYDKWRAYIEIDGKRTYLGDFSSKSAAVRARKKAAEKGLK